MALSKNQLISLRIDSLSYDGAGVGRAADGTAVFVPMAAPGDLLRVRIVKALKSRAYGIIDEITEPSPIRIENDCPVYRTCGGCSLRHLTPAAGLSAKDDIVRQNLRRIGRLDLIPDTPLDAPGYARYRNKAAFPVRRQGGKAVCGFFAPRSHRLVPIRDCLLQPAFFARITDCVLRFCDDHGVAPYDEEVHEGLLRHIVVRHAAKTGEVMVCLVINGEDLPSAGELTGRLREACPSLTTLVLDHNIRRTNVIGGGRYTKLFGKGFITDELCGVRVRISPGSFYQINRDAAELLYRQALEYASPGKTDVLLDLYCGAGTIGLSMAAHAGQVIGVESVAQAVEDARANAAENGIQNARFLCMDAGEAAGHLKREGLRPNIIVTDPPRAGMDEAAVRHILALAPERLVYISCNSATLARDCSLLAEGGYRAVKGRAVNLFGRTAHIECVILMVRMETDSLSELRLEADNAGKEA